jgi:hypothetical protein
MDFVLFPGQTPLDREKDVLIGADGAPNCRQS